MDQPSTVAELELAVRPMCQHQIHRVENSEENRACWLTCALMLLNYRGPQLMIEMVRLPTLARTRKNHGIQPDDLWRLAKEAGMEHAAVAAVLPTKGAAAWHRALSELGPLIVVVGMHTVVVRGLIRKGEHWQIVYNDPFPGTRRTLYLQQFNEAMRRDLPILFRRSAQRAPFQRQPVSDPYGVA